MCKISRKNGCEVPGSQTGQVWNCGEMASTGSKQFETGPVCTSGQSIIYAWAMDAPKLTLPPDVSFDIGQETSTKYLVLQVHYKNVTKFLPPQNGEDNSGLTLETSTKSTKKRAGVFFMGTSGSIPPHSIEYFEAACPYQDDVEIKPFAFRTHAHSLGRVISGYRIRDGEWAEIGRKDPRLPEMFYNATTDNLTVKKGDILAARCTMENGLDHTVSIGNTQKDEMCNFYIMYYVDTPTSPSTDSCYTPGPPHWYWTDYQDQKSLNIENIPDTASVIPGSDSALIRNTTQADGQDGRDVDPDELAYLLLNRLNRGDEGVGQREKAWLDEERAEPSDEEWAQYIYERQLAEEDPYAYYQSNLPGY